MKSIALAIVLSCFAYSNVKCMDTVKLTEQDKESKIEQMYAQLGLTNNKAIRFEMFLNTLKDCQDKNNLKIHKTLYHNLLEAANLFSKYKSPKALQNTIEIACDIAKKRGGSVITLKTIQHAVATTAYGPTGEPVPTAAP